MFTYLNAFLLCCDSFHFSYILQLYFTSDNGTHCHSTWQILKYVSSSKIFKMNKVGMVKNLNNSKALSCIIFSARPPQ